jgi:NAD+ kinase
VTGIGTDEHRPPAASGTRLAMLGVVVHPQRRIDVPLDAARAWAAAHAATLGQVPVAGQPRRVAATVAPEDCDLLLAIGGDGTVLAALGRAGPVGRPVLGVACGSLGVLTSVAVTDVARGLDWFVAGGWEQRALPGLAVSRDGTRLATALNDVVIVRRGAGQVILEVDADGEPYARTAGDGAIVATALGSSAYTLAARGPLLSAGHTGMVLTPLGNHAGSVPPLVLTAAGALAIAVDGGWTGARIEIDGRAVPDDTGPGEQAPFRLDVAMAPDAAQLLTFDGETQIAGLRRRGVIADSPRWRARDERGG